ncbi:MAG: hypothetical protein ACRDFQ_06390 [Anaerolineales bacterium]
MHKTARFPYHPLLIGVFPVVALMAANIQESPLEDGLRALVVSLLASASALAFAWGLSKDLHKAAVIMSILLIAFFSYGHVYTALKLTGEFGTWVARHRILLPLWLITTGLTIWSALKKSPAARSQTSALNIVATVLIVIPLFQISSFLMRDFGAGGFFLKQGQDSTIVANPAGINPDYPDIYYIIPDSYSRQDLLEEFYHYDNSEFLNELRSLGFYVADCSLSNYTKTRLSLSSSLNMDYLENLGITAIDQADEIWRRIRNSAVRKTLAGLGYKIVSLETGFYWTEWPDADIYFTRSENPSGLRLNSFETLMLQTTLLRALFDLASGEPQALTAIGMDDLQEHYAITRHALDALDNLAFLDGPKFVFSHLLIPHEPYVFDAEGNFTTEPRSLTQSYDAQITYLNRRLINSLSTIIRESERPVIIILQADTAGPGTQFVKDDRMKILNAYYLPKGHSLLYSSITPVNSFRVVFDTYFGTNYGLLEDLSYFSTPEDLFDVNLVGDDNPNCLTP